jgi:hypothetical protein
LATKFGVLSQLADENRLLLNYYDDYIKGPRDLDLEASTLSHILTKNRETAATGERDRTGTWSASAAGHCLRQQQFVYLGMPAKGERADVSNIFINGDFVHLRYQMVGLIQGWLTDAEIPITLPEYNVRGTMDGDLGDGVLEIKSINSRGFASVSEFGPKEAHKKQATAYMLAKGYVYTRFIYENKDNNQRAEFLHHLDPVLVGQVEADWILLNEGKRSRTLFPMQRECVQEKGDYRYCPFATICEKAVWPRRVVLVND